MLHRKKAPCSFWICLCAVWCSSLVLQEATCFQPSSFRPRCSRAREKCLSRQIAGYTATQSLGVSQDDFIGDDTISNQPTRSSTSIPKFVLFASVGFLYWYLMVFAAAAHSNGLPVPDFIPLAPGWPPSNADLAPVMEDSYHFFYLSELLRNADAPYVSPARLAVFNLVEAWIVGFLPLLWKDSKRLPRPILLLGWSLLGINLTNAFLAPYLAATELMAPSTTSIPGKNRVISAVFGLIVWLVVVNVLYQSIVVATPEDWSDFFRLAQTDRTYLAFCLDTILLTIFQPLMFARTQQGKERNVFHYVPIFGLIAWLLLEEDKAHAP